MLQTIDQELTLSSAWIAQQVKMLKSQNAKINAFSGDRRNKTFTRTEGHRFNQTNLSSKSLSLQMDSARACTQQLMFRASHEYGNLPGEEIKHSDFKFVTTFALAACNNLSIIPRNKRGSFLIPLPF